jgi:hypothetical protein
MLLDVWLQGAAEIGCHETMRRIVENLPTRHLQTQKVKGLLRSLFWQVSSLSLSSSSSQRCFFLGSAAADTTATTTATIAIIIIIIVTFVVVFGATGKCTSIIIILIVRGRVGECR